MRNLLSSLKWMIPGGIALVLFGAGVVVLVLLTQHQPQLHGCGEAMRRSLVYQGTAYYASEGANLTSAARGALVTTIGDGRAQAHSSCLAAGSAVYSVQGCPITAELALDTGDGLWVFAVPPATATPTASTATPDAAFCEATAVERPAVAWEPPGSHPGG